MKRKLDDQYVAEIEEKINQQQFMRGKKFAKEDTRTAEQKLLDMPCSPTIQ